MPYYGHKDIGNGFFAQRCFDVSGHEQYRANDAYIIPNPEYQDLMTKRKRLAYKFQILEVKKENIKPKYFTLKKK